jgi:four helix bundle protein
MEKGITSHHDMYLWKVSLDFVNDIYRKSDELPSDEGFGIRLLMKRAAISICNSIAEAASKVHRQESGDYLFISLDFVSELKTQLDFARKLGYIESADHELRKLRSIKSMIRRHLRMLGQLPY